MSINKKWLSGLLLALMCAGAQAHDGTVNITGSIVNKSCTVSPDSQDMTVPLGTVAGNQFRQAGDGSRYEPFRINLENCVGEISSISINFAGTADGQNADLLALPTGTGNATGLGIGIYDNARTLIPVNQNGGDTAMTPGDTAIALDFYARYVATGPVVTPGTASASATFTVVYA